MTVRERETPSERLAYAGYATGAWLARSLPERAGLRVFRGLGGLAHVALPRVRAIVEANQAQVLGLPVDDPLVRAAGREAFELYARYWHESFRAPLLTPEDVARRFVVDGCEHFDRPIAEGRGAVAALPHMGNWDVAGRWVIARYSRIAAVAEDLKPRRLADLFLEHRRQIGMNIVPLSKGAHVGQQLARLLADNWIVALVADRDLGGRGIEVEMFGRLRSVPAGPALLSIKTGSPLVAAFIATTDEGWHCTLRTIEFEPTGSLRADVTELTRRMAAEFERAIATRPPDWHLFQPGWER